MNNQRVRSILLCLMLLACFSCGGEGGDPLSTDRNATSYGGSLTLGSDRANLPVSEDSALAICQILNPEIYGLCKRALFGVIKTPQVIDSLRAIRISGTYSGYALIEGQSELRADTTTVDFTFQITLYDFSDSGAVFMGGEISASGYDKITGNKISPPVRLVLDGGMAFAGKYAGAVEYNSLRLPIATSGKIISVEESDPLHEGSQTLINGALKIRFNPYYKSPGGR
jgi:hypothetical protein